MNQRQLILPAVAAAIFNEENHVLLQRRKNNQWGLISGHIEFGEDVKSAVVREIEEETGLKSCVKRLIGIYSSPETQTYITTKNETIQYITHYFEADLLEPFNGHFRNDETRELRFFAPECLPDNLILMHPTWLTDALQNEQTFIR